MINVIDLEHYIYKMKALKHNTIFYIYTKLNKRSF